MYRNKPAGNSRSSLLSKPVITAVIGTPLKRAGMILSHKILRPGPFPCSRDGLPGDCHKRLMERRKLAIKATVTAKEKIIDQRRKIDSTCHDPGHHDRHAECHEESHHLRKIFFRNHFKSSFLLPRWSNPSLMYFQQAIKRKSFQTTVQKPWA